MQRIAPLAALLALATHASAQSWSDDFNRADGPIGGSWTTVSGTWAIVNNQGAHTSTATNTILQHTLASGSYASTVAELDVFSNTGTASYFSGVLIGLGGADTIMVKIQDQSTTLTGFTNIGIYHRTSATAWGAWTGTGSAAFAALSVPFVSGRMKVFFPTPDTIQIDIDTDFNGTADQTYSRTGVGTIAANLGLAHGLSAWNTTAVFDNWNLSVTPQPPSNNTCVNASVLNYGTIVGTTSLATNDGSSSCDPTGNDVWYAYTAPTLGGTVNFSTCGSAIDTVLSVYDTCGGNLLACNDNGAVCTTGVADALSLQVTPSQQLRVRISDKGTPGAFNLNTTFQAIPPCPGTALTTAFAGGNGGSLGGQVFFDLNVLRPSGLTFSQLEINAGEPVGSVFTASMYTTPGTYVGNEINSAAWTLVGTATGVLNGANQPSIANFATPITLPAGSYGVALIADTTWGFDYTTGTAITQYSNADLELTAGAALNVPWTGTPFTPRLFNGSLRYDCNGAPPSSYCTAGTTTNGCNATLAASGTPSASATSGFTLSIANVEGQKQGLLFYSITGRQAVQWGTGTSFLCVKSPTQRLPSQSSGGSVSACDGSLSADWLAFIAANPSSIGAPLAAGQVFQAQGWFRDPPAPKSTSLSNALEFTLLP